MNHETAFLKKVITPDVSALLIPDPNPRHPRQPLQSITNIVAWMPYKNLSDDDTPSTVQVFKLRLWKQAYPDIFNDLTPSNENIGDKDMQKLLLHPYPGIIQDVIVNQGAERITLATSTTPRYWKYAWCGWIYITAEVMHDNALHYSQAVNLINRDLQQLEDFVNNAIHAVAVQRNGAEDLILAPVYTDGSGHPSFQTLDHTLITEGQLSRSERDAVLHTQWRTPIKRVAWDEV